MGNSNGKIEIPVSVSDVSNVLGAASSDVGTLCTHPNINMWARYKPVRYSCIIPPNMTLEQYQDAANAATNYGIVIPTVDGGISRLLPNLLNGNLEWSYEHPNNTSGYNLASFHSYNHKAVNPVISVLPDLDIDMKQDGSVGYIFATNNPSSSRDGNANVTISLLRAGEDWSIHLSEYYLGVIAWNPKDTAQFAYGANKRIGSGNENFEWSANFKDFIGNNQLLEWKYLPFLSSQPISSNDQELISTILIGCNAGVDGKEMTIHAYNARFVVTIVNGGLSNGEFAWRAYVYNYSTTDRTITGWDISVYPVDNSGNAILGGGTDFARNLNITATANKNTYIPSSSTYKKLPIDMNEEAAGYMCTVTFIISGLGTNPTSTITI